MTASAALAGLVAPPLGVLAARGLLIAAALGLWYWTQAWLARRPPPVAEEPGGLGDGLHNLTAPLHRHLRAHPRAADALLLSSSLLIDLLGLYLLGTAILGPTLQPFLGLFIIFVLRQICQALCPLPPPPGMIWRSPGFPTLLVTYGTANDLFFSGHTAIAVFGAATLAANFGPWGLAAGGAVALFEIAAVLVLRAHYTLDVYAGAVTALLVYFLAAWLAPTVDAGLGALAG